MKNLLPGLIAWYTAALQKGGFWAVVLLMAAESSIVPIPSEVIIPPAAHLAYANGALAVWKVIFGGVLGSWIGAAVMYWGSRWAGRPLILAFGKYVFISPQKVEAAERWSTSYGSFGIFFSRLLPVVRHLIGIPAGIVRLPFGKYSLFTILGSGLWCCVLAYLGIKAGQDDQLMKGDVHRITLWAVCAFLFLGTLYYTFVFRQMKKSAT